MQYRIIPSAEFHSLPEHFKILKNFQEMHASLLNLGDEGLIEIVPNYEGKFNIRVSIDFLKGQILKQTVSRLPSLP